LALSRFSSRLRAALPSLAAGDLLTFACWSGIAFGLAEGVMAVIRRRINHMPTGRFAWNEFLWMPPLAAVVGFVSLALAVILLDRVFRRRGLLIQLAPLGIVIVGVHDVAVTSRFGISNLAAWVLGLGCAVALTRLPSRLFTRVRHAARWQLPLVLAGLALWAVGVPSFRQLQEQRARESLPPADPAAPNVLIILWDTVRALSLSLYGHTRETTPELTRFAQRGTVFEHVFASSSWSLPSHASIYTGRYPHETNVGRAGPLDDTHPTLGDVLARHGYVTGGFTGNLFYGSRDFGMGRGFSWYDDEAGVTWKKIASTFSLTKRPLSVWLRFQRSHAELVSRQADDVSEKFLRWVDRRGSRPFYAFVNYFDAHAPYFAPSPFNVAFSPSPPRYWIGEPRPADPKVLRELETAYESSILYLDRQLAQLLAELRQRGVLDNTLVIVTSDHGEQFGDHGTQYLGHERSLYTSALRVPLVMVFPPRVPAGVRRSEVVSVRDIPETVLDALGIGDEEQFPGTSLLSYANGTVTAAQAAEPRLALLRPNKFFPKDFLAWAKEHSHVYSLAADSLHYLVDASGEEELYDFVSDPWERVDLTDDPGAHRHLARFREVMDSILPGWQRISADTLAH
jgi:arylsulfatase A-like enzyme